MDELNLSGCTTNKEVREAIAKRVEEVTLPSLIDAVSKDFIGMEEATTAVFMGLRSSINVYLYGKGGYGKSDLMKYILGYLKIPYHVIVGHSDLSVENLIGIPDMKKFREDSEYSLNFSKSIFTKKPGILIGEEFGDVMPSTAAALKDILSEGGYRDVDGKTESLIGSMVILSNRSPQELAVDDSTSAFYLGRFPITFEVKWDKHDEDSYMDLLEVTYKRKIDAFRILAKLFAVNGEEHNNIVTPRKALMITKSFLTMKKVEYSHLKAFGIDITLITKILAAAEKANRITEVNNALVALHGYMGGSLRTPEGASRIYIELLGKISVHDENIPKIKHLKSVVEKYIMSTGQNIKILQNLTIIKGD